MIILGVPVLRMLITFHLLFIHYLQIQDVVAIRHNASNSDQVIM